MAHKYSSNCSSSSSSNNKNLTHFRKSHRTTTDTTTATMAATSAATTIGCICNCHTIVSNITTTITINAGLSPSTCYRAPKWPPTFSRSFTILWHRQPHTHTHTQTTLQIHYIFIAYSIDQSTTLSHFAGLFYFPKYLKFVEKLRNTLQIIARLAAGIQFGINRLQSLD